MMLKPTIIKRVPESEKPFYQGRFKRIPYFELQPQDGKWYPIRRDPSQEGCTDTDTSIVIGVDTEHLPEYLHPGKWSDA